MGIAVFVADEQTAHPVDNIRWVRLAHSVLEAEGVHGDAELSMLFVDEESIADLNKRFLGKDGPTDVLAFPVDGPELADWPEDGPPPELGDVVVCPDAASDPLETLVVHGLLHLLGHDHETDDGEMLALQDRLVAEARGA